MDVKISSKCWGYSRRPPKNWRKYFDEQTKLMYEEEKPVPVAKQEPKPKPQTVDSSTSYA